MYAKTACPLKIAQFEFKVTVHYGLWAKCTQLWPLNTSFENNKYNFKTFKQHIKLLGFYFQVNDMCHTCAKGFLDSNLN